jgi:hypothetical protein
MTYEMDLDKFGGAAKHFIAYDEPPPEDIREECLWRLADYAGFEMFAMTPLGLDSERGVDQQADLQAGPQGRPDHDRPGLDPRQPHRGRGDQEPHPREQGPRRPCPAGEGVGQVRGVRRPDLRRRLRGNLVDPPTREQVKTWDVLVGIDPGIRNAGSCGWVSIRTTSRGCSTPAVEERDAGGVREGDPRDATKWGVKDPFYVIDPAARARAVR